MLKAGKWRDIHAVDGKLVVLSHYPLATPLESINIHGHLHEMSAPSEMHLCVSVEQSDYYPVLWKTETPLEAEDETDRFPVYTFVP